MSNSHSFPIRSWSDVYQRLRAKAEASRGIVTLTASTTPGATFPHTTSRDAFAIALVFDTAVNDHAFGSLVARWIGESDLLAGEPGRTRKNGCSGGARANSPSRTRTSVPDSLRSA